MFKIVLLLYLTTVLSLQANALKTLAKTGQIESLNYRGDVITDGSNKDDGFYQTGVVRKYSRFKEVVTDHITGLEWQDDIEANSTLKRWGVTADDDDTSGDTASTYCSTLSLDGGGWRLPTIDELESIVDYGIGVSSLDEDVFLNSGASARYYWSSTSNPSPSYSNHAYYMDFSSARTNHDRKTQNFFNVRCVRGSRIDAGEFSRNDLTEVVTDLTTGLEWEDDYWMIFARSWEDSINFCETNTLDGGGWRMPNHIELLSITDQSKYYPSASSVFIRMNRTSSYWSSTSSGIYVSGVDFYYGLTKSLHKTSTPYYVRCVRGNLNEELRILPSTIMYLLN